jgi:hypothetical protein
MENEGSTKEVENQEPLVGVITKSKAWHAYMLKMAGLSLVEVADRLGYTNGAAVAKAIRDEVISAAKDTVPEDRETLLDLEVARLDYAQAKIWMGVEAGDPKSVDSLLKIIALRTKLRGLDTVDATVGQQTVLVIGGQTEEYIAKLKAIVEDE